MRRCVVTELTSAANGARSGGRISLRNEWLMLFALIVAAALLLAGGHLLRGPDRMIYDHLIGTLERPSPDNIVIVAIDDKSIDALGRWPWKRGTHAQLLNVLSTGSPRAIGLDLILTEGDAATDSGDRALAQAIAGNGHVVLPILSTYAGAGLAAIAPYPEFTAVAAGLGHIQLNFSGNGIVRSVNLYETLGERQWKTFALALLEEGSRSAFAPSVPAYLPPAGAAEPMGIPFLGPPGHVRTVSYIDVLRGVVPAHFFRDKYVLVGAAASGLGDVFPVPQVKRQGLMSGVELHANILAALQEGRSIRSAPTLTHILFAAIPALLMLVAFLYLSPRYTLALTALLTAVACLLCWALVQHGIWLPPSATLLLLWMIYPLWSWRRLEVALRYLDEETGRLALSAPFAVRTAYADKPRVWDFLERRIDAARTATQRMLDLHQFVSDNLNSMPDANLVIDNGGSLMLYNRKAQQLFSGLGIKLQRGLSVADLLTPWTPAAPFSDTVQTWTAILTGAAAGEAIEATDRMQRIFMIRSTPSQKAGGETLGWIVSLADVTAMRKMVRLRDESLNFISHDMRSPQSAILATLELQRSGQIALDQEALFARIEKSVRTTLNLAEDFILLTRAESRRLQQDELDFRSLLADASDEVWALANDREVRLNVDSGETPCWVRGDRMVLVRALTNLLSNAIKYGPRQSQVDCRMALEPGASAQQLRCAIRDHGPGLSEADMRQLFTPFYRSAGKVQYGAGLGLSFVKSVMEHHGGSISAVNADGGGTCFTLVLPCATD